MNNNGNLLQISQQSHQPNDLNPVNGLANFNGQKYCPPHLRQNHQQRYFNQGIQSQQFQYEQNKVTSFNTQQPYKYNISNRYANGNFMNNNNTDAASYDNHNINSDINGQQINGNSVNNGYQKRQYNNNNNYNQNYNNNGYRPFNGNDRPRVYQNHQSMLNFNEFLQPDYGLEKKLFCKEVTNTNFEFYEDIPVEVTGQDAPEAINTFDDCDFHDILKNNIKLSQYEKPTPVQKHALPIILAKRDLMACAQTGSGKTAAFLVPILNSIYNSKEQVESYKIVNGVRRWQPIVLILAPTRELALQIYDEAKKFAYRSCLRSFVVYGGADIKAQMKNLDLNGCHLLVATPGRLIDLYNKEIISFENIKYLVLDEADRMLDMGFEPQIREIVQQKNMPNALNRQTLLFSATFPKQIQLLAKDFLNNYIFLTVGRVGSTNANITQRIVYTTENDKHSYLVDILDRNPQTLTLIFVETRRSCDELEKYLLSKRFGAISIHGKKSQSERERALQLFRNGNKLILVATAVAARGLDISNVKMVINFDLPNDIDDYVHRIGRTGRCGNLGEAISFFNEKNRPIAHELCNLLREAQQDIPDFLQRMAESRGFKRSANYQNSYKRPSNDQYNNNSNGYPKHESSFSSYRQNLNNRFSNNNEKQHSNGSYASYDQQKTQNGFHQYQSYNSGNKYDSINSENNGANSAGTNYSLDSGFSNNAYLAFLLPQLPPPPPPPEY